MPIVINSLLMLRKLEPFLLHDFPTGRITDLLLNLIMNSREEFKLDILLESLGHLFVDNSTAVLPSLIRDHRTIHERLQLSGAG